MNGLRTSYFTLVIVCGIAVGLPCLSLARTWLVEKDGSGDSLVIQDAVDAAASGDTIRIGPGRYNNLVYATSAGWADSVRILVTQHELTIVGSGPETIIGQEASWTLEQGDHKGIVASDFWGNNILRVSDLRFENMRDAIFTSHENTSQALVIVAGCIFYNNLYSLALIGDMGVAEISDCDFSFMPFSGVHVIAWNQDNVRIDRCTFGLSDNRPWSQKSVSLINISNATIDNCSFLEGSTGLVAGLGGPVIVRNSLFDGQSNVAFYSDIMSNISVDNCRFRNQTRVFSSGAGNNQVTVKNSVVEDVSDCTALVSYIGSLTVNNCDLAAGTRGVVYVQDVPNCTTPEHFDMTGNYWGTSNLDSIPLFIRDQNDSAQACYTIDYEPILPIATPLEKESWGGVKALFR